MDRKLLARPKVVKPRQPRKKVVPFDRHALLPKAVVDAVFLPQPGARVYAWRTRSGERPQWHVCSVVRIAPDSVELWDETLGQWFCFDPRSASCPDVRMENTAVAKPTADGVPST